MLRLANWEASKLAVSVVGSTVSFALQLEMLVPSVWVPCQTEAVSTSRSATRGFGASSQLGGEAKRCEAWDTKSRDARADRLKQTEFLVPSGLLVGVCTLAILSDFQVLLMSRRNPQEAAGKPSRPTLPSGAKLEALSRRPFSLEGSQLEILNRYIHK